MQAALGILVLLVLAWLCGERRGAPHWRLVLVGLGLQFALALLVVQVPPVRAGLLLLNGLVEALQAASDAGAAFVFGFLAGPDKPFEVTDPGATYVLAVRLVPQILLFSVLAALGWYWRLLPWLVRGLGRLLERSMGLGGALGLGAGASVFLGMVEAPLLIRPLLARLDRGELFALMTCGMATVAGTVMVLFASILEPVVPGSLGHILAASIISAPAALLMAHLMIPVRAHTGVDDMTAMHEYRSTMDAITGGTAAGVRLAVTVMAMLIVFVALVALINALLALGPDVAGAPLTLERIFGWLFAPLAWLIGVPWSEAGQAGELLGIKLILNELIGYIELAGLPAAALSERSRLILTYAMCGFANLGSLGILVGGLTAMCPERRGDILALAPRTLVSGMLATLSTGAVIGLVQFA